MAIVPIETIASKILLIRRKKVMLDRDLAELYHVSTKRLNEQVKRNIARFPEDFMFQLTGKEAGFLRSHFATSKRGGRRYLPFVFTEQGVAMLSSILHSERAIQVNIVIMRTFVRLRQILSTHKALAYKLEQLERKIEKHNGEIRAIFDVIHQLITPTERPKRRVGFHTE